VLKILDGVQPSQIPEVHGTNRYMFDWRAVQRWHLDARNFPAGSVVLFRELTPWERYKPQIIAIAVTILALSILSIYLAFETQRRRRAEAATAATLRFEQIISELSAHFIDLPSDRIDSGINEALNRLVKFLEIDRLTVFKFSPDARKLVAAYASRAPEVPPSPAEVAANKYGWYVSKLLKRESVVVNRLSDLPSDAQEVKRVLQRHGVRANVAVPIEAEGVVFGCLSFVLTSREMVWTDRLVTQLKMAGQVIGNALVRKETDEERQELSGLLINAQEAERTRLAGELHDDFSQRIAVLAVDLERIPKKIANLPVEAKKRLHELWNLVTELGADLHSLSHTLHSSTLDSLGLVDALDSLCEEFAEQNSLELNFVHERVPQSIPHDTALCLFRIVQEALRNVKKHSHASGVELRLSKREDGLHLSIVDNGIGFNISDSAKRVGLGLRSMQERLRLIGGHLQMHSGGGEGTKIEAWVPLHDSVEQKQKPPAHEVTLGSSLGG
jgi:signal transduction histidine kinase